MLVIELQLEYLKGIGGKNNRGQTKIFEYNGTDTWVKLGSNINGTNSNERSGNSVSLNGAGDFVAIGSNGYSSDKGRTRIFQLINGSWTQLGSDIEGEASGDESGKSVSLNSSGNIVAIGALIMEEVVLIVVIHVFINIIVVLQVGFNMV